GWVIAFAVGSAGAIFTGFVTLYIVRGRLAPAPAGIAYALDGALVCAVSMFALGASPPFATSQGWRRGARSSPSTWALSPLNLSGYFR
ncbi:MAG TPA: hypothetical protein VKB76_03785, partial [Ktedonobacterales bacterium]|nr:hypothetical protein [Ktedonobacterales bacterium]